MKKINIGVAGCGNISGIYFKNLTSVFANTHIFAVADLIPEKAKAAQDEYGFKIMTIDELINSPDIHIILNITQPQNHFSICKQALEAGKHVYVEKPLALNFEQGKELVQLAEKKGLMLGGAPDTFLGAGIQTARKLVDSGFIGQPIGATAFMMNRGHESWHPSPEFYYEKGGGPMFDMGPYYLTALINLLGGVSEVSGMTSMSFPTRTITSEPKFGKVVNVEVPTHVCGMLRFKCGAIGNIITSFDVVHKNLPFIEVYGTLGSLLVPDPNTFGGPVKVATMDKTGYKEIPLTHNYSENSRGIGVADMAQCIIDGKRNNRAGGALINHVLEILCAIDESNNSGTRYAMTTSYQPGPALPADLVTGMVV